MEYLKDPESAFSGNGNIYKEAAKNHELERLVGKLYAENEFLKKALSTRKGDELKGLIHHSDQGVQYASIEYVDCLKRHDIQVSMSRTGNPYDNAFAESFIETLKCEEVYLNEYETFNDALANIDRFIAVH